MNPTHTDDSDWLGIEDRPNVHLQFDLTKPDAEVCEGFNSKLGAYRPNFDGGAGLEDCWSLGETKNLQASSWRRGRESRRREYAGDDERETVELRDFSHAMGNLTITVHAHRIARDCSELASEEVLSRLPVGTNQAPGSTGLVGDGAPFVCENTAVAHALPGAQVLARSTEPHPRRL